MKSIGGNRNTWLFSAVTRLLNESEGSRQSLLNGARAMNNTWCEPPLLDEEVRQIVASVESQVGRT